MNWFKWWKRKETKLTSQDTDQPENSDENAPESRREFVYLDDAAVVSLLASNQPGLEIEWTDQQARSLETSVGAEAGISAPGARAGVTSSLGTQSSTTRNILRKSIVQSRFGQLLRETRGELLLTSIAGNERLEGQDAGTLLAAGEASRRALPVELLCRGEFLEVEVQLSVAPIYAAGLAFSSVMDVAAQAKPLIDINDSNRANLAAGNAFLQWMLAGTVPVESIITSHRRVTHEGKQWIVDEELAQTLSGHGTSVGHVVLVGLTEVSLYWTDLRRILYDGNTFHAYARIKANGLSADWEPVKQKHLLTEANPDLGHALDQIVRHLPGVLRGAGGSVPSEAERVTRFVSSYVDEVGGRDYTPAMAPAIASWFDDEENHPERLFNDLEVRRSLTRCIDGVLGKHGVNVDPLDAAVARYQALAAAEDPPGDGSDNPVGQSAQDDDRALALECEIVALYW